MASNSSSSAQQQQQYPAFWNSGYTTNANYIVPLENEHLQGHHASPSSSSSSHQQLLFNAAVDPTAQLYQSQHYANTEFQPTDIASCWLPQQQAAYTSYQSSYNAAVQSSSTKNVADVAVSMRGRPTQQNNSVMQLSPPKTANVSAITLLKDSPLAQMNDFHQQNVSSAYPNSALYSITGDQRSTSTSLYANSTTKASSCLISQAHTPPESVSPKSANGGNHNGTLNGSSAFSPHSTTSSTSTGGSSLAVGQQLTAAYVQPIVQPRTKRARQEDCHDYGPTAPPLLPTKQTKKGLSSQTSAMCVPNTDISFSQYAPPSSIMGNGFRASTFEQPLSDTCNGSSELGDFDQFSTFGGDLRECNEHPIKFYHYQRESWAPLYGEHEPVQFTVLHVEAEKGFNYSMYDQVHVCQKKNHFQIACQFQTSAKPCYIGYYYSGSEQQQLARIADIHMNMYGIKLDAPDQKVRLQQSAPDRKKQNFSPLSVQGLGETQQMPTVLPPGGTSTAAASLDLMNQLNNFNANGTGAVKLTVGRLHFADTTMNNMRKKGKPNRSQQYFALIIELSARDVNGKTYCIMSMISDKCIVRASNPGQFESNLDVTWLKSPNAAKESIFHKGNVGINVEKPSEALEVCGNIKLIGGHLLNPSDERIKTDIEALDPKQQLENVTKLKVYKYRYKDGITQCLGLENEHGEFHDIGFLAQEVAKAIPDAVEISGDLILVNGEVIENLQLVNKDRVFIDTVAAVGELSRVLDVVVGRLEHIERSKRGSSLQRSDSLRSITSSVTQISNRLRMLMPSAAVGSDGVSSHYGYTGGYLARSNNIATTPLNEMDENDDDEAENEATFTVPKAGDNYSTTSTLSTHMDSVSQNQQQKIDENTPQTQNNRFSLTSTLYSTGSELPPLQQQHCCAGKASTSTHWYGKNSLVLPTRKKSLMEYSNSSASSMMDSDRWRPKNCYISRCMLFLLVLLCIALLGGLIPAILIYSSSRRGDTAEHIAANALIFPPNTLASVDDRQRQQDLLTQYKMLPKMLTRTETIQQCSGGTQTDEQRCAKQYDRQKLSVDMCCAATFSTTSGIGGGELDRQLVKFKSLLNRDRIINFSQQQRLLANKLLIQSASANDDDTNEENFLFHTVSPRITQQQQLRTTLPAAVQTFNSESPRVIMNGPMPTSSRRRLRRNAVPTASSQVEKVANFTLYIAALNLTLDNSFCQKTTTTDTAAGSADCRPRTCKLQIPLQNNFPMVSLEVTLQSAAEATAVVANSTLSSLSVSSRREMDLCAFEYPVACNEDERMVHESLTHTTTTSARRWQLPVGYYLSSSYRFVIARGQQFTSSLSGVCDLLTCNGDNTKQELNNDDNLVVDLEFKRICT